jgi:uncharacterized cupin superfamily protein
MNTVSVRALSAVDLLRYVPPLSDYAQASPDWTEAEYRFFDEQSERVVVGFWTGEPGEVELSPWPYTEVCSILSGRVAVRSREGEQTEFAAGTAFLIPKGFDGTWITLETTTKLFVAIS